MKEELTIQEIQMIVDFYQKLVDDMPNNVMLKHSLEEWKKRLIKK